MFVLELAVVHDLGHGRLGVRRDLYKIEVCFIGQLASIVRLDNADLFSVGTDESDLGDSNSVVDASFSADVNSSVAVVSDLYRNCL